MFSALRQRRAGILARSIEHFRHLPDGRAPPRAGGVTRPRFDSPAAGRDGGGLRDAAGTGCGHGSGTAVDAWVRLPTGCGVRVWLNPRFFLPHTVVRFRYPPSEKFLGITNLMLRCR